MLLPVNYKKKNRSGNKNILQREKCLGIFPLVVLLILGYMQLNN